jgi:putative FmdB family regulatory protein
MAGYVYRCAQCGPWELQQPIGTADSTSTCPGCGSLGRRVFTPPLVSRTARPVAAARLREEASRDEPEVTGAVPAQAARRRPLDPRWTTLPRP